MPATPPTDALNGAMGAFLLDRWVVTMFTFFFYGIYTVLVWMYIYLQSQHHRRRHYFYQISLALLYLLITILTVLYTLSIYQKETSNLAFAIAEDEPVLPKPNTHDYVYLNLDMAANAGFMIANILADTILICRCYFIWGSRKSVVVGPVILCASNIALTATSLLSEKSGYLLISMSSMFAVGVDRLETATILSLGFLSCSVVTNILLTVLIATRIWWLSRVPYNSDQNFDGGGKKFNRLIVIIVESGSLYTISLIITILMTIVKNPDQFLPIVAQIMGIAPTLIIVRIDLCTTIEATSHATVV
ncbi:hypothetical protein BT96DRAFT_1023951 [Gymnopus androsaceus JB14]|uniref:Uncharacterized protein n=1 Tax=Gymnopus androsaceus JB14 TaxID=1447944 RepID=A0A6A4H2X6_9AGAR|nr:hypothetical protein BT96DRAFT_1023951 [Gymnopus androsaceus JB14]